MHKDTGKMAVLYASSKESKRRLTGEKNGTSYFEEDLRPASSSSLPPSSSSSSSTSFFSSSSSSAAAVPGTSSLLASHPISYLAASGIAISKVLPPSLPSSPSSSSSTAAAAAAAAAPSSPEEEKEQKYRVDRLYLIFSTMRRWDVPKIFQGLEWA